MIQLVWILLSQSIQCEDQNCQSENSIISGRILKRDIVIEGAWWKELPAVDGGKGSRQRRQLTSVNQIKKCFFKFWNNDFFFCFSKFLVLNSKFWETKKCHYFIKKKFDFVDVDRRRRPSTSKTLLFSGSTSTRLLFSSRSTLIDARRRPFYSLFHHALLRFLGMKRTLEKSFSLYLTCCLLLNFYGGAVRSFNLLEWQPCHSSAEGLFFTKIIIP